MKTAGAGQASAYFALHPRFRVDFLRLSGWKKFAFSYLWKAYVPATAENKDLSSQLKWVGCKLPSVYELLPDQNYINQCSLVNYIDYIERIGGIHRTIHNVDETYFGDDRETDLHCFSDPEQIASVRNALEFKSLFGGRFSKDDLMIFSDAMPVADFVVLERQVNEIFQGGTLQALPDLYTLRSRVSGLGGDGVVTASSAVGGHSVSEKVNATHAGMPSTAEVHRLIERFLNKS